VTTPLTRPGRLVAGRYRLLSQIGGGGMGRVWSARDELLGRTVALKQVLPPPGADPRQAEQQRQRSLREGRIAARLSHPHAISVYDVALEGDEPWLVMEYLPSRSLAEVLAQDGVLRVDQAAQIGAQVADALAATHAAGIVHRDVKPANVLIGEGDRIEGLVKITDFGISHAVGDVTLTQTGQITGTPAFLAPEVAQGDEPGPASDVFSLGATLYTCLEGAPPFGMSGNSLQQLHRVAGGQIDPPQRCGALTRPLLRMLAADPAARPSMTQVRDELASLAAPDGDTTTVLTARTDLRPSAPGAQRTATFPVPASPAAAGPPTPPALAPAAAPAPRPAARPDARPDATPQRRRRRPALPVLLGVLVALFLLGGLIAFVTMRGDAADSADPPSAGPTTSDSPTTSAGPTSSTTARTTTTAEPTTTTTTTAAPRTTAVQVDRDDVRNFVRDYHDLLPDDPEEAWQLTGPTLRSTVSEDDYVAFWSQFDEVKLSGVQVDDGSLTATGQLEYRYADGRREREQHRFTLVVGDDGELLLDSDVATG
jgi:serine/threonine protein kinase